MSYTPTVWATGDVVTATKLNKLENGVANISASPFTITVTCSTTDDSLIMDKTAGEIMNAIEAHIFIIVYFVGGSTPNLSFESWYCFDITGYYDEEDSHTPYAFDIAYYDTNNDDMSYYTFRASESTDYPSWINVENS